MPGGDVNPSYLFDNYCLNFFNANFGSDIRDEPCGTGAFPGTACWDASKAFNLFEDAFLEQCNTDQCGCAPPVRKAPRIARVPYQGDVVAGFRYGRQQMPATEANFDESVIRASVGTVVRS